jgi:hypothetical protein
MSLARAETGRVQSPDVADEQVAAPVRGNNDFAFAMYGEQGGSENLVFSPYRSPSPSRWPTATGPRRDRGPDDADAELLPQEG